MENYLTASVEFYYRGEKITASIELDLDQHMQASGQLPNLYPLLAQTLNLDIYSYEYEMMLAEDILFRDAKGLVAEHVNDGLFDREAFASAWSESFIMKQLQQIAKKNLSMEDLQQQPELKNALLEAYNLGKKPS
ncbi:MAG: hypothetical protein RQ982_10165 [Gammaproteobacteria bacterium]|nr:hypothetical protein [Gammaproteobacteria bacterium]